MKSKLSLSIFITCFAQIVQMSAQEVRLQVAAGASIGFFKNETLTNFNDGMVTPVFRGGFEYLISEKFHFQVQSMLTSRRYDLNFENENFTYSFFTAEIPVMLKYNISDILFTEVGCIGSVYGVNLRSDDDNSVADPAGDFRNFDFGVGLGFGFNIAEHFSMGLRSRYSFVPMLELIEISEFGETSSVQKDIYYRNAEIYMQYAIEL